MNFPGTVTSMLGGMIPSFLHWSAKEWPITYLHLVDGMPLCEMMAFPEMQFAGYSLPEQSDFKERTIEDSKGVSYEYRFSGKVKDRYLLKEVLAYMLSRRHFVVCSDRSNQARLLGRPGNMAQFVWEYETGTQGSDDPLISWSFSWLSKEPAPYVPIDICSLVLPEPGVDPSPLEEYVEAGYWLSEYTS